DIGAARSNVAAPRRDRKVFWQRARWFGVGAVSRLVVVGLVAAIWAYTDNCYGCRGIDYQAYYTHSDTYHQRGGTENATVRLNVSALPAEFTFTATPDEGTSGCAGVRVR